MKRRVTAIILLFITAMFTIRPAIALHFCMGQIHSFQFYVNHVSCEAHPPSTLSYVQPVVLENNSCCDDAVLELSTDVYENHANLSMARHPSNIIEHSFFLFTSLYKPSIQGVEITPFTDDFPPDGRFLNDIDILKYICIYRI